MTDCTTVTLGIERDDGEFAILATINNTDEHLPQHQFQDIVRNLARSLAAATGEPVRGYERQDTPDYIDLDGSERLAVESVDGAPQTDPYTVTVSRAILTDIVDLGASGCQFAANQCQDEDASEAAAAWQNQADCIEAFRRMYLTLPNPNGTACHVGGE